MTDPRALAAQIVEALFNRKGASTSRDDVIDVVERVLRAHQDAQSHQLEAQASAAIGNLRAFIASVATPHPYAPLTSLEAVRDAIAACVQERDRLTADLQTHKLFSYAQTVELAEVRQERDRLRTREATYHSLIAELHGLINPEDHPDVAARASAVLLDCENPVCALDSRLFHAEDRLREVEAERDRLRGALRRYGTHDRECVMTEDNDCSCGLDDLLAARPPTSA